VSGLFFINYHMQPSQNSRNQKYSYCYALHTFASRIFASVSPCGNIAGEELWFVDAVHRVFQVHLRTLQSISSIFP